MRLYRLVWQVPAALLLITTMLLFANEFAIARPSRRVKDIPYVASTLPGFDPQRHILDVYSPRKQSATPYPVVVFIHGGSWNSGRKNLYTFIGRRLAKQGVVAVIINYQLAPTVEVPAMVDDCARAVLWTRQHIADYGGDPNRIYVMGHSAGGGLAALLTVKDSVFSRLGVDRNPISGAILDDPAGLDMFDYLTKMEYPNDEQYLVPFGKDPAVWRQVSALYHLTSDAPPILMYAGERTYPSIASSTRKFEKRLQELGIRHEFKVLPGKKHIPMVTQLFWQNNIIYRDLLPFVGAKPST
ncbi:alpha/beta hydrolase [Fibrisoma montanum]|uniref:Alpha/beta hydrolase n=1 Tax=Fibrisoma montanum TaxID=2305895 RepID=A0A418MBR1_9BACT|nr:alpha/beta hydrolase [Fibrisoma montanum]RIV23804.1 alpha/beta hydrolase [Fibrisoma montanum]